MANFARRALELGFVSRGEKDFRAFSRVGERDRSADAATRTGDERDFAYEFSGGFVCHSDSTIT